MDSYTRVVKESETPRKAFVVRSRRQVKAGWNSEEEEKLKRGRIRNPRRAEESVGWNTAQAMNARAGGTNPIGSYIDNHNTLKSKLTS